MLSNRSVHRANATRLGFKLLGREHGDTAPPSPPGFSAWRSLSSALPILAVLGIPYVLFLLALAAFRGPKKGALPWTLDFLGNALLLFLLLALFRDPRWYAALAGAVVVATFGVCLWHRRLLRSVRLLAADKSAKRSLVNAALGSVVVLVLIWYLLGAGYTLAGALAAGVVAAMVFLPWSGRGHAEPSTTRMWT